MLIEETVPRVLAARGVSRLQIASCLRAIDESKYTYTNVDEAKHVIQMGLGTIRFHPGHDAESWGISQYEMAIAKGVRMIVAHHGYNGSKTGTYIEIDGEIPVTSAAALHGEPLHRLIEHPLLDGQHRIASVRIGDGKTQADIWGRMEEIATIAPASQRDMEIARWQWYWMHRRQAWQARAVNGLTFKLGFQGSVLMLFLLIVTAILTSGMTYTGHDATVACLVGVTLSLAAVAGRTLWKMGEEDSGLEKRLESMRRNLEETRRADINSGNKTKGDLTR